MKIQLETLDVDYQSTEASKDKPETPMEYLHIVRKDGSSVYPANPPRSIIWDEYFVDGWKIELSIRIMEDKIEQ